MIAINKYIIVENIKEELKTESGFYYPNMTLTNLDIEKLKL